MKRGTLYAMTWTIIAGALSSAVGLAFVEYQSPLNPQLAAQKARLHAQKAPSAILHSAWLDVTNSLSATVAAPAHAETKPIDVMLSPAPTPQVRKP